MLMLMQIRYWKVFINKLKNMKHILPHALNNKNKLDFVENNHNYNYIT